MTKKKRIVIAVVCIVVVMAAAAAFLFRDRLGFGGGNGQDPVYVISVAGLNGTGAADRFAGVVEAQQTVDYKKDGDRSIKEVYVKAGDNIKAGDQLFKYDVGQTENDIASARLDIEGLNNDIELLREGGDSTEIKLQISAKQLEIRQKEADIKGLQQQLDKSLVKATADGVVKQVNPDGGYSQTGAELPIVSVMQTGEFRVKGKVSEQSISAFTVGQEVIIRSRVDESQTWTGKVSQINTEPETDNQQNFYGGGTENGASAYPFYVALDSTEGLMLGQHVYIEPDYGQGQVKEGIWIDQGFIVYDEDGGAFVWAADKGRLKKRTVKTGEADEAEAVVEILEGLDRDDLIAWPDETLREGMKVVDSAGPEPAEEGEQ